MDRKQRTLRAPSRGYERRPLPVPLFAGLALGVRYAPLRTPHQSRRTGAQTAQEDLDDHYLGELQTPER
jgi:hypothetical protein